MSMLFALLGLFSALPAAEGLGTSGGIRARWARAQLAAAEAEPRESPVAQVFRELTAGAEPPEEAEAELLRFVTAYGTGLEALVDATPYAPLLKAAAADARDSGGNLSFYAFVDTWVNNGTGRDVLYLDNDTGLCTPLHKTDGNGWRLDLDLLLWPRESPVRPTAQPRQSLALASGYFGGTYRLGEISILEGEVVENGTSLELAADANFAGVLGSPPVIACPEGAGELRRPSLLGYVAEEAASLLEKYGEGSKQAGEFAADLLEMFLYPKLLLLNVTAVSNATGMVHAAFKINGTLQPEVGLPVYYEESDVYTDRDFDGTWLNSSYPFERAGEIVAVGNGSLEVRLLRPCLPRGGDLRLPRLLLPKNSSEIPQMQELVSRLLRYSREADLSRRQGLVAAEPLFLKAERAGNVTALAQPLSLGRLRSEPGELVANGTRRRFSLAGLAENGTRACAVRRQRQGGVFRRDFRLDQLQTGDRVLLQLTVTGHGWSATTEQCGEFCRAVYELLLNGRSAGNVSQFREDCGLNPINGSLQHGTWSELRNGWCPGTVEPGLFLDVTDFVNEGANNLAFEVSVWSNRTGRYEAYTDFAGFAYGDQASLVVGMNLFVYGREAVEAVPSRPRSAAEAALRYGSSQVGAPRPPVLALMSTDFLTARVRRHRHSALWEAPSGAAQIPVPEEAWRAVSGGYDFEARAPWYLYSTEREGLPAGAVPVSLFKDALLQGASRRLTARLAPGALEGLDWGRAGLRLRLAKPFGNLSFDHWDRVGSVGLLVDGRRIKMA